MHPEMPSGKRAMFDFFEERVRGDRAPLHPDCASVAFLLGTWRGRGSGSYPTIEDFRYLEEIAIWHTGKPFLVYCQRTWDADTGEPLHQEVGYFRPQSDGRLEAVIAHPTGIAEVLEGRVDGRRLSLESVAVALTLTAKDVRRTCRIIRVEGVRLDYEVKIAAVGVGMTPHLHASLTRVDEEDRG